MIWGISSSGQSSQKTSRVSENCTRFLLFSPDDDLDLSSPFRGLRTRSGDLQDAAGVAQSACSVVAGVSASSETGATETSVVPVIGDASDALAADACCSCAAPGIWNERSR